MVLKKCPCCKNVVSWESYCCPRCGIEFRAYRIRRVMFWTTLVALCGWAVHRFFLH